MTGGINAPAVELIVSGKATSVILSDFKILKTETTDFPRKRTIVGISPAQLSAGA